MKLKTIPVLLTVLLFAACSHKSTTTNIIPKPSSTTTTSSNYKIPSNVVVTTSPQNDALSKVASQYIDMLKDKGIASQVQQNGTNSGAINLIIDQALDTLTAEGYIIDANSKGVNISSSSNEGIYRALSSLEQLIDGQTISGAKIVDKPRFAWRGVMLDVARHFQPVDSVKKFIDILAYHKINKLHLHLTDGVGWRIEIDRYPLLTQKGAYRKLTPNGKCWENFELFKGERTQANQAEWYGDYFTKDDIRQIVAYAADRYIEVIPEIEMPGHSDAAIACYPAYTCQNAKGTPQVYCAGNDGAFEFLANILDETFELFPSQYIHVGGDEVPKAQWLNCPRCKARMQKEGLKDGHELQSYFMKRMNDHIVSKGKKMIGWDEITEGGLPDKATVMSWTGFDNGVKSANSGYDVIMTPGSHCYFDHYQGNSNHEPQAWGGFTPTQRVYEFEPVHQDITPENQHHILGGQANIWTEQIPTMSHLEYMMLPRLSAMSEVLWSQKDARDWESFKDRLLVQLDRYDAKGYNYAQSAFTPTITNKMIGSDTLEITLATEIGSNPIYYTLDGSKPTTKSMLYSEPIIITECTDLKAQTFKDGKEIGYLQEMNMLMNKAVGAKVSYENPYNPQYSGGGDSALVDNLHSSKHGESKLFQGVEKEDFIVTLDLHKEQEVSTIALNYFQHLAVTQVVLPPSIEVYSSLDGKNFELIEKLENIKDTNRDAFIKTFTIEKSPFKTRYIKVVAQNIGVHKEGTRKGENAWVFMDEIAIN